MAEPLKSKPTPADPSSDYEAMLPYWSMVRAIMGGLPALIAGGEEYLPRHENESRDSYNMRLKHARLTNIYEKVIGDLSMRPFTNPITIGEGTTPALIEIAADVDLRRNPLDEFAETLFESALTDGMTWVVVDQPSDVQPMLSVAEERRRGIRPFWRQYNAIDAVAAYSDHKDGRERLTELRLLEYEVMRSGWEETIEKYVRVFRLDAMRQPEWERWKEERDSKTGKTEWIQTADTTKLELEDIPAVPFWFGKRSGNGFQVKPPLRSAAALQIELYQEDNNLKNISNLTAFPMLAANGMTPVYGKDGEPERATIGPKTVLYGGQVDVGTGQQSGSWEFVEPAGTSLNFLEGRIEKTIRQLLELGRQALHSPNQGVTRIEAAGASESGNSLLKALVILEEMAIHRCMMLTAEWMNETSPVWEAEIFKDFAVGLGDSDMATVIAMAQQNAISKSAMVDEAIRRGILARDFDKEGDLRLIIGEIDAAMGYLPGMGGEGDGEGDGDDE